MSLVALLLAGDSTTHAYECESPPRNAPDRFFTNDDGTVTDLDSGLTWMRCSLGQQWDGKTCAGQAVTLPWTEAQRWAQRYTEQRDIADDNPWRLPQLTELATLVELRCRDPRIDRNLFPNAAAASFWTATRKAGDARKAYALNFGPRGVESSFKDEPLHVRLVRGRR